MDPATISIIITALGTLAKVTYDVWQRMEENKQKELDREAERLLQKAEHTHQLEIEKMRRVKAESESHPTSVPTSHDLAVPDSIDIAPAYLSRLNTDATALSAIGFDVVFETVGSGYGIALTQDQWEKQAIVFWLSEDYPRCPPLVLVRNGSRIERIEFESDAWSEATLLADIATALLDGGIFVS